MVVFQEFYKLGTFEKSLNAIFIPLITKKSGAMEVKDFWQLICLLGGIYKLIAKVLANRLRLALGNIISGFKNAFVKER